jgi:hypothetical protein
MRKPLSSICRLMAPAAAMAILVVLSCLLPAVRAEGGDASVIHACTGPQGQVRIVTPAEACRPSETPAQWKIVGPPGPAGPGALIVVDKNEMEVGPTFGENSVILTIGGAYFSARAGFNGFVQDQVTAFYYTGDNCSGDVFMSPNPQPDAFFIQLAVRGTTGYYSSEATETVTILSWDHGTGCALVPFPGFPGTPVARPMTIDLSGFTPPFSIK